MTPAAVFFDLDDTLMDDTGAQRAYLAELFVAWRPQLPHGDLEAFVHAWRTALDFHFEREAHADRHPRSVFGDRHERGVEGAETGPTHLSSRRCGHGRATAAGLRAIWLVRGGDSEPPHRIGTLRALAGLI